MLQLLNLDREARLKIANEKKKRFMTGVSESGMPNMNNSLSQIRDDQSICQSTQEASQYSPSMKTISPSFTKQGILSPGKSSQRLSNLDKNERLKIAFEKKWLHFLPEHGKSRSSNTQSIHQDIQINEEIQSASNTTPTKLRCQTLSNQDILSPENFSQRSSILDREKRLQIASLKKRLFVGLTESNILDSSKSHSSTRHGNKVNEISDCSQNPSRKPPNSIVTKQEDLSQTCSQILSTLDKEERLRIASEKKKRFNVSRPDLLNVNKNQSKMHEAFSTVHGNKLNNIPSNSQNKTVIKRPHSPMTEEDTLLSRKCGKRAKIASEKSFSVSVSESHLLNMNISENRTLDSQSTDHSSVNNMPQFSQNTSPKRLHLPSESNQHNLTPGKFSKSLANLDRDERLRIAAEKKKRFIERWISQSSVSAGVSDLLDGEEQINILSENKTRFNLFESDLHDVNISQSRLGEYRSTGNNIKENDIPQYSQNTDPKNLISSYVMPQDREIQSSSESTKNFRSSKSGLPNVHNRKPRTNDDISAGHSINVNDILQYSENNSPSKQSFTSETTVEFISPRMCYEPAKTTSEENTSILDVLESDSPNINNNQPRVTEFTDHSLNVNGIPQYTQNKPPKTPCLPFVSSQDNFLPVTNFQRQVALNRETRLKIVAQKKINFINKLEKQRVIELQNIIPSLSWAVPRKSSPMISPTFPPKWHSVAPYPYP